MRRWRAHVLPRQGSWLRPIRDRGGGVFTLRIQKHMHFEGHDAHLALCPPASGRHDAKTSYGLLQAVLDGLDILLAQKDCPR